MSLGLNNEKLSPDRSISRLKARLELEKISWAYGIHDSETFSPDAKMTSVSLLISLAATHNWTLH